MFEFVHALAQSPLFESLLTGLVSPVLVWLAKRLFLYLVHRRSPITGEWVDQIYDDGGTVVKQDRWTLRHNPRTREVRGTLRRTFPDEQSNKKWKVRGVVDNDHMALVAWSNDPSCSDVCVYAQQVSDFHYEGHYIRRGTGNGMDIVGIDLNKRGMAGTTADDLFS